jgi:hypothetical protein
MIYVSLPLQIPSIVTAAAVATREHGWHKDRMGLVEERKGAQETALLVIVDFLAIAVHYELVGFGMIVMVRTRLATLIVSMAPNRYFMTIAVGVDVQVLTIVRNHHVALVGAVNANAKPKDVNLE